MPQVNKPQAINVIMYINDGENEYSLRPKQRRTLQNDFR